MEYRTLGASGLRVSALALGTLTFGDKGPDSFVDGVDAEHARAMVDQAVEAGVNLIDTANYYSRGRSEEIVGEVLAGRRDRFVISTKVRNPMGPGPNDSGLSRSHLIASCEASLRRLQTDYIDIFHMHERDGETPAEETLDTLNSLVHQGKVRYIGCSNYTAWQTMQSLAVSDRRGLVRFVSQEIYYSLLHREAEYELIPLGIDEGVGALVWGPMAGGWLSGKFRRGVEPPSGARHASKVAEPPIYDQEKLYDTVEVLVSVADTLGCTPAQVALAYLLAKPGVTSLIFGARRPEQLAENLDAADVTIDDESRRRLDEVSSIPLIYPHWHQSWMTKDRRSPGDRSLLD